jgi:hypothetical protein
MGLYCMSLTPDCEVYLGNMGLHTFHSIQREGLSDGKPRIVGRQAARL